MKWPAEILAGINAEADRDYGIYDESGKCLVMFDLDASSAIPASDIKAIEYDRPDDLVRINAYDRRYRTWRDYIFRGRERAER